jgi:hypothetical protein
MADRHRGYSREFDRTRGRGPTGAGGAGGAAGPGGPRGSGDGPRGREPRDGRGPRDDGGFRPPPAYRERRPPAPPVEADDFEDVDADLAVAILDTAAKLTEIVGTTGLPEGHVERREAVIESFEAIYFAVLDAVTGGEDDDEEGE